MIIKKLELTENGVTETFRDGGASDSINVASAEMCEDGCVRIICMGKKPGEGWFVSILKEIVPKRVILCSDEEEYELQIGESDEFLRKSILLHFFKLDPIANDIIHSLVSVKARLKEGVLYIDSISSLETGENFIKQLINRWKSIITVYTSIRTYPFKNSESASFDVTEDIETIHNLIRTAIDRMDILKYFMYTHASHLGLVKDQEESKNLDWEYVRLIHDDGKNQHVLNIPLNELAHYIPITQLRDYFNIKIDDDGVVKLSINENCKNLFCISLYDRVIMKSKVKSYFEMYIPSELNRSFDMNGLPGVRGVVWNTR